MKASALLAVLLLAGCIGSARDPHPAPAAPAAIPVEAYATLPFLDVDHDHTDPTLHQGAAAGLAVTGRLPLLADRGTGYFGEMDIMGDLLAVAIEQNPAGVVLVDISDPDHPERLSHIALDFTVAADVKFTPDGKTLFVATSSWLLLGGEVQRLDSDPDQAGTLSRAFGVIAYDVSNPASPREIAYLPVGRDGVHMLDVHVIGDVTYLFAATPFYSLAVLAEQVLPVGTPTNAIEILSWSAGQLLPVARYDSPTKTGAEFAHDMTVVEDGDQVLMLCAYYDDAAVADGSDPANPRHLGSFSLPDNGVEDSDVHTVMLTHVGDRRILVTSPELAGGGEMLTLDATDLTHITLLGRWGIPGWDDRTGGEWSPHNVNLADGKAYLAHYHAGAWVLDIGSEATLAHPDVVGYFAPADATEPPAQNFLYGGQAPSTWEVIPAKGRVFVTDMGTGLYVLQPTWTVGQDPPYGTRGA
jgi:hypothetical protein